MTKKFYFLFSTLMLIVFTSFSQVVDTLKTVCLNNIEVIGIRPVANTPISQKTITSLDISKNYHGEEMTYILEKTPSITTQSDGGQPNGYTYFRIRGIDQTRINVTFNGSPLNEPEDQGAYYSNYPGFATYIKSIQVQRGIGTSSNGTASYGGSINFESKDGLDKGINGNFTIGSFNTKQISTSYGSGLLKNKMAFFGGISAYTTDGYRYNSGGNGISAFFSGGYFGTNDVVKLITFTGMSFNQMAWLPTPEHLIKIDRKTNILSEDEVDKFNQSMVQLQYIHSFKNNNIITSNIYYNRLDGKYSVMFLNSDILNWYNVPIDSTKTNDIFNYNLGSNFFGGFVNYKIILNNLDINTGLHLNTYNRKHLGVGNVNNSISYENIGYKKELSAYIKTKYTINKLLFYGDVQLRKPIFNYKQITQNSNSNLTDTLSVKWGVFVNPMLGVTYKLSKTENLYTSIGLTHREPTRNDMFGGDDYYGLISIKPESVIDYELGYKINTDRLNFNINLYYMYFNNQYIPSGKFTDVGLMNMVNVNKSYRTGIEIDGKYKICKTLTTSNSTTLSYNKILDNNISYMLYSPNIIFNQDIEYAYKNFYINLSVKYISDSYINLNNKNDISNNYTTLNTKIGLMQQIFDISLSCINLTNTKYYTFGNVSNDGIKNYFVGTPISFYVTLSFNL